MLRFLMTAAGLALIAVTVGALLLLPRMERYAVPLLERGGTRLLGTPVTCEKIRLAPLLPGVELSQVCLQADGATGEPLVTCERVAVRLDPTTAFAPDPVLTDVVLDGLVLHLRPGSAQNTGLTRLISDMLERESIENLNIERIRCINGRVSVADNLLPGDGLTVPLDDFEMNPDSGASGVTVGLAALRRMLAPLGGADSPSPGLKGLVAGLSERLQVAGGG